MIQLLENIFIIVVFGIAIKYIVSLFMKQAKGEAGACSSCSSGACSTCPTAQKITDK
ncbi:hypothetical protein [Lacihabitans sp. CCS-44]|uniref:hypothetical protein n=1 Tax=Lacihabitans sp. CCS-44 TaxID=2487331 RepID=UPI0020CDD51A|nr:hypothetical protein [Lacihabitans sp. CCS-44]